MQSPANSVNPFTATAFFLPLTKQTSPLGLLQGLQAVLVVQTKRNFMAHPFQAVVSDQI